MQILLAVTCTSRRRHVFSDAAVGLMRLFMVFTLSVRALPSLVLMMNTFGNRSVEPATSVCSSKGCLALLSLRFTIHTNR